MGLTLEYKQVAMRVVYPMCVTNTWHTYNVMHNREHVILLYSAMLDAAKG